MVKMCNRLPSELIFYGLYCNPIAGTPQRVQMGLGLGVQGQEQAELGLGGR
jgi:hypothetical protein